MAEYNQVHDVLLVDMDWLEEQVEEALKKAKCEIRTAYVGSQEGLPVILGVSYQDNPAGLRYEDDSRQEAEMELYNKLKDKIVKTLDQKVFGDYKLEFTKHLDGETVFLVLMKEN